MRRAAALLQAAAQLTPLQQLLHPDCLAGPDANACRNFVLSTCARQQPCSTQQLTCLHSTSSCTDIPLMLSFPCCPGPYLMQARVVLPAAAFVAGLDRAAGNAASVCWSRLLHSPASSDTYVCTCARTHAYLAAESAPAASMTPACICCNCPLY